jgi:hypothetical protein
VIANKVLHLHGGTLVSVLSRTIKWVLLVFLAAHARVTLIRVKVLGAAQVSCCLMSKYIHWPRQPVYPV